MSCFNLIQGLTMIEHRVSIDRLIELVRQGGRVKTGVDVYDRSGTLLLAKDILVDQVKSLEIIRRQGLRSLPLAREGGVFDLSGNRIGAEADGVAELTSLDPCGNLAPAGRDITRRLKEIREIRREAVRLHEKAVSCLKKALAQIRQTRGQFDLQPVESQVLELVDFLVDNDQPFAYMARDLFSHDDYLFSHAVHVCALGTAVVHRFNASFSKAVETALWADPAPASANSAPGFSYYFPDDLKEISLGLFVYDMGKAMVPLSLLNKPTPLTPGEFKIIRRHSHEYGGRILEENRMDRPTLANLVQYHHGPLFEGEKNCYPRDRSFSDIPPYVRICKLSDIYDAMISRRSYKEAANQVAAATTLFRTYVKKDPLLQYILHAFVSTIGLYPPGSIVFLKNGQMAYVLESRGPIVLPFTDTDRQPLSHRPDPFDTAFQRDHFQIDNDRSVKTPKEVYNRLPPFIRDIALS